MMKFLKKLFGGETSYVFGLDKQFDERVPVEPQVKVHIEVFHDGFRVSVSNGTNPRDGKELWTGFTWSHEDPLDILQDIIHAVNPKADVTYEEVY